jgi:RNA polymerase sigma-70 factor (ECF subfamily)
MESKDIAAASPPITDEMLVKLTLEGDDESFRALMIRHQSGVYRLAYYWTGNRDDAQDLCQECFVHLYRVLDRYDHHYRFHVWMYKVCNNRCINWLKSNRRAREIIPFSHLSEDSLDLPDRSPGPADHVSHSEIRRLLMEAVHRLPENYRVPVILRFLDELSYKEIAASMGITVKNVEIRLHRAKKMLYETLKGQLNYETLERKKSQEEKNA